MMKEENKAYITGLDVRDVPWHRLTTAYGRGTDFPEHFAVLERMDNPFAAEQALSALAETWNTKAPSGTPRRLAWCSSAAS